MYIHLRQLNILWHHSFNGRYFKYLRTHENRIFTVIFYLNVSEIRILLLTLT